MACRPCSITEPPHPCHSSLCTHGDEEGESTVRCWVLCWMSGDFFLWVQILRTPSLSSVLRFPPIFPIQTWWVRTQLHGLCFLNTSWCLYLSSGVCLHCATKIALLTKLLGDVFVALLFQFYLFLFQYLTFLKFPPWHSLFSLQDNYLFGFFSCLSFSVLGWGMLKERKVGCSSSSTAPTLLVFSKITLYPSFLSTHFCWVTSTSLTVSTSVYILVDPTSLYICVISLFYATFSF